MGRVLGWMAVAVLCCAATAAAGEPPADGRLREAQQAHDEAKTLEAAGRYAEAMARGEQALVLREAVLGGTHPDVAHCLELLGRLHRLQGDFDRAESLIQRALALREEALGKHHPDVAVSLNGLALLKLAQHRLGAAVPLSTRAFATSEQRLRQEALSFSEERLASLLQLLRTDEEHLYALLREHPENASVRRLTLSAALLLKGRSVEEMADISRAVYRSLGPEEHDTFTQLRGLRAQLARLSLQGPGPLPPALFQRQLEELTAQGDAHPA